MEIDRNSTRILLRELREQGTPQTDMYGIRLFPTNSIPVILDLGANCGFYSVPFRFLQPNARIIAIEPDKNNFKMLVNNVKNLEIETYNLALGNGEEVEKTRGKFSVTHKFVPCTQQSDQNSEKCQSMLLSDIVATYEIDPTQLFMKIDTEGAERFIFNHEPSEEIIRKSIGTSMETHNRLYGIFDVASTVKWAEDRFSKTHCIFWHSNNRTAVHMSIFRKDKFFCS